MKTNLSTIVKNVKRVSVKHSPEILTGIGIAGMITTTILAIKATPKALDLIAKAEDEKFDNGHGDELTKMEVVKATWKCYIPAAISGTASIACLIGANSVNAKRNTALATAYKLSEKALVEYKNKVVETIGEKKEKQVREKIAQDKLDENPASKNTVILTEKGNTLCYDSVSGRYFKSNMDAIQKAINNINRDMTYEMYVSLSNFYDEIGLEHTSVSDYLGWNMDSGLVDIDFDSRITDNGEPCLVLDYRIAPRYDFDKLM